MANKKYRVRFVLDDVVEAQSPEAAKEHMQGLFYDGFYGSKAYQRRHYMTARRRKDLETE
jgi:hypothetical protein